MNISIFKVSTIKNRSYFLNLNIFLIPAIFIAVFLLLPIIYLLASFFANPLQYLEYLYIKYPPDGTLIAIYEYNDKIIISIQGYDFGPLINSLLLASLVSLASTAIGVITSITVLTLSRFRVLFGYIFPLLASIPAPLLSAYAVINLFHRDFGIVNKFLDSIESPFRIALEGIIGVAVYQVLNFIPLVHIILYTYYETVDRSLIDSATVLGGYGLKIIRRILIPLSYPAILAVFSLIFILSIEDLAGPIAFSRYNSARNLLSYLAYTDFISEYGYTVTPRSIVYTSTLVIIALIVFMLTWRYLKAHQYPVASIVRIYIDIGKLKYILLGFTIFILLASLSITILIIIYSFTYGFFTAEAIEIRGLSNYLDILVNPYYRTSILNTIIYTAISICIMAFLGILASYTSLRVKSTIAPLTEILSLIPIVIPGIAVGIGYFMLFHNLFSNIPVLDPINTPQIYLVLAYTARRFPYMFRPLTTSIQKIPYSFEESAYTLGAKTVSVIWRIIVPLSARGLIAGVILSSLHVSTEFSTTVVLVGGIGIADLHPAPIVPIILNSLLYNPLAIHVMSSLLLTALISSVLISIALSYIALIIFTNYRIKPRFLRLGG